MPSMNTPVVLTDTHGTVTTFNPKSLTNGVATFTSSNGVPLGDKRLSMSHTTTTTGREKVQLKVVIPVIQDVTVNGVSKPTIVRSAYADLTFTFDSTSNTAERAEMREAIYTAMANPIVYSLIDDLGQMY